MEQDLAYARLLAGLHGARARREVAELVSFLVEVGAGLPLSEDKLTTIMEAAQVPRHLYCLSALVDCHRKSLCRCLVLHVQSALCAHR